MNPELDPSENSNTPATLEWIADGEYSLDLIPKSLYDLCENVLSCEKAQGEINIILTGDALVRQLNGDFRNKDKTTDVLSFPSEDEDMAHEIYVSIPQVERQAPRFEATFDQEISRVIIHGLLHILGYDHIKAGERKIMRAKEEDYLQTTIYHK